MLLNIVKPIVAPYVAWATWLKSETDRANRVALAREYADGEHRSSLTEEMRNLLRIKKAELGAPFNLNHMDNIIQTVVDRLAVTAIESDNPNTTEWLSDLLNDNRFDGLQIDAHEAAVRDGDAYIMVSFDNTGVKLTLEDAFDGTSGIVMIYGADKQMPLLALKIWQETTLVSATGTQRKTAKLVTRVNAYYPDRLAKYISYNNASLQVLPAALDQDLSWTMVNGDAIGIPIIHFKNRSAKNRNGGKSEIRDAIPLQDAINRTLTSMIMSSELTSFPIRYSIGLKPPVALTPGMWINAYIKDDVGAQKEPSEKQLEWLKTIRFGTLEPGQIMPFIEQSKFAIEQMYTITRTPRTDGVDSGASGESLKQKEIGLVGKVNRCHVSFGNAWENVAKMAWRVASAYDASQPPEYTRMATKWKSAEIRNDTEIVDNVLKIADRIDERTVLQLLSVVFDWDTEKIESILNARRGDAGSRLADLARSLPTFDTFNGQTLTP